MADSTIQTDARGDASLACHGVYWTSGTTGAFLTTDSSGNLNARKTTDAGVSLATAVQIANPSISKVAFVFDRQIVGDSGTLVHEVYLDGVTENFYYDAYDISADAWTVADPGKVIVFANYGGGGSSLRCFITKTRSGNLIAGWVKAGTAGGCFKSSDTGASWTSCASPWESNAQDRVLPAYCNTGDDDDGAILFWDISANQLSVKVYDDSGDSWTETTITGTFTNTNSFEQWDATTRLSDGHMLLACWSQLNNAASDLATFDILIDSVSAPTVTAKADVLTDTANAALVSIFVDQFTDDVYVAYGIGTWSTAVDVVYKRSTDDMATWGSQHAYSEQAATTVAQLGRGAMGASGGNFEPEFFVSTANDNFYNLVNAVALSDSSGGHKSLLLLGVG